MRDTHRPLVIGSETQFFETFAYVTGIQRVLRETHLTVTDTLGPHGIRVVPVHTRNRAVQPTFRSVPYLASDPVLDQRPARVEDVDALMLLDLHTDVDFARIFRERRRRRLPVIGLVHDILPITNTEWVNGDPRRVFRLFIQQMMAVADHIVVSTHKVKRELLGLEWKFAGELHVIGMGTTFPQRVPEAAADDRVSMLYVSTIDPRKGHDLLLAAYDVLRARGYDVDLTMVGRHGWDINHVVERLRSHPDYGGRLRWLPGADDLTVATIARDCSIGVFPAAGEGFGLFVEEGLSYGLKMVVSDIPEFRERAQPNLYFSARTPEAFADAILHAHDQPWNHLERGSVRTMQQFGQDIAELVRSSLT